MAEMLHFVRRHFLASVGLALGGVLTLVGLVNDARDLWGLPPNLATAIGAVIFMMSVLIVLYRWDRDHHGGQSAEAGDNWLWRARGLTKKVSPSDLDREALEAGRTGAASMPIQPARLTEEERHLRGKLREFIHALDDAYGKLAQVAANVVVEAHNADQVGTAPLRFFFDRAVRALPTPKSMLDDVFAASIDDMDSIEAQSRIATYLETGYQPLQIYICRLSAGLGIDVTTLAPTSEWLAADSECARQLKLLRHSSRAETSFKEMSDDVFGTIGEKWRA
jgi:hypothetical protein